MQVELLNFVKEILGYYGLLAIVSIYFFYNLPRFFDSVSYLSSRKIKSLEEALKSSYLNEFDKNVIKDSLSDYYLKKATNLYIDKRTKIDCLEIYHKLTEAFTLLEIEKAFQIIDTSVIDFDLTELEREHKRLKLLNNKPLRVLMLILCLIYFIFIGLWVYFSKSYNSGSINLSFLGSVTIFEMLQVFLIASVVLIILDNVIKALNRIKKINAAIDIVVFLKSKVQPNT